MDQPSYTGYAPSSPGPPKNVPFDVSDLKCREPVGQFRHWMEEAEKFHGVVDAHTMTVATATKEGVPSARQIGMQKIDKRGIIFLTSCWGRKAKELEENPHCSLVFHWAQLKRSVRVEGTVERAPEESEAAFAHLPRGLQIMSHTGITQSTVIPNRESLVKGQQEAMAKYSDESKPVPKSDEWGCYRVIPTSFEFWCMQTDFLADRLRFRRPRSGEVADRDLTMEVEDGWLLERLA